VYAIVLWPNYIRAAAGWLIVRVIPRRFRARVLEIAERFVGGFASVRSIATVTQALGLSITVWTAETISYRLLMNSFGFRVGLHQLLLMSGLANLGTALPSGPANIGTFDLPAIEALAWAGINRSVAASYQIVLHAVLWSTETLAGLWFAWRTGLGTRGLAQTQAGIGTAQTGN
jgi:hypothetical protein